MPEKLTTRFEELDGEQTVFELDQLIYEAAQELRYWEAKVERLEDQKRVFIASLAEQSH